jgi:hypothetical protein
LNHSSATKRFPRAAHLLRGRVALVLLGFAGCQSGAQQDLVSRELRMQEDQLYAMKDYLSEYQQLVCKYRSENAALRQQLSECYPEDTELPPLNAPARDRRAPRNGGPAAPSRDGQPDGDIRPETGPVDVEPPEVPSLESSTERKRPSVVAANLRSESNGAAAVTAAKSSPRRAMTVQSQDNNAASAEYRPARTVAIHGEVIASDAGRGPRLAVDVVPKDATQRGTHFAGTVSLMLLASEGKESGKSLARWDFKPAEVEAAIEHSAGESKMRFYLELPDDTLIGQATQIWVRLLPPDGAKLLAHAEVDLQRPGEFASDGGGTPRGVQDNPPEPSAVTEDSTATWSNVATELIQSGWTTARPGKPESPNDPPETAQADSKGAGRWRTSTEVIPLASHTRSPAAGPRAVKRANHSIDESTLPPTYHRPTWTPDRPRTASASPDRVSRQGASHVQRPSWSATR